MSVCAYCERPLECDVCRSVYRPADSEAYRLLSQGDEPIVCPGCAQILVCHWCKTPYDGQGRATESGDAG